MLGLIEEASETTKSVLNLLDRETENLKRFSKDQAFNSASIFKQI